jgi:hypothetical protein
MKHIEKFNEDQAQFTYNKELNPKFWTEFNFDDRIRKKLLTDYILY